MGYQLDQRTRKDQDRRLIVAPHEFFGAELPVLLKQHGAIAAEGYQALRALPLTIQVADDAWTLSCSENSIQIVHGHVTGSLMVTLTPAQFTDWVQNELSFNGMLVARALNYAGGSLEDVSTWDSLWAAVLEGWPLVDDCIEFRDARGGLMDLTTSFGPNDPPDEVARFLREAGFVHLRGWIDHSIIEGISREMDEALPDYVEGDGRSWWAQLEDDTRVCVRMQEFVERSPSTRRMLESEPWERLIQVLEADDRLARKPVEGRIIEALFKPVGVVSGPSDLSFHRDCHLGRHSYACARMTVGVAITPSGPENGQLRIIAGSHRLAMPVERAKKDPYLPLVALVTEPGDLTVHLSCTLHEATCPVTTERRVLYTEIPLHEEGERLIDTSVGHIRGRINDIVRS